MYQRGYFRDSYNSSNLLWLFDLSWWRDVLEVLVGKDGKMSPENAECFLRLLEDRESVFQVNLAKVEPADGETRAEVEQYFRKKYERLKAFLRQGIDRKECIQCTLWAESTDGGFRREEAGEQSPASFFASLRVTYDGGGVKERAVLLGFLQSRLLVC